MSDITLEPPLLAMLQELHATSPLITTIANGRPNRIVGVGHDGVWIETEASQSKDSGPQLVPAWMIQVAWEHLRTEGSLENTYLLATDGLNVKRSSAVCALLARLPGVHIESARPIRLAYVSPEP